MHSVAMKKVVVVDTLAFSALALTAFLAMTISATAQGLFAVECSQKDIAVITLLETRGEAGDVPAERLGNAALTILDARSACSAGRVGEAIALYQSVLDLGPVASIRRERP
jgi:hypothetical protein